MHPCLETTDLVLLIFDFLYEDEKPSEIEDLNDDPPPYRPSSTAALALTCHAFCDHALARVWHTQYNLVNLVKCMPADIWQADALTDKVVSILPQ